MTELDATNLLTVPQVAVRLGWPFWKANYWLLKLNQKPVMRAATVRLYNPDVVDRLRASAATETAEIEAVVK